MRAHGLVSGVDGLGVHDHVCWLADEDDDWLPAGIDFLTGGLRVRQRLVYVGPHAPDVLARRLAPLGDVDALRRGGRLAVHCIDELYDVTDVLVPEEQLAKYEAVNELAVAEGYDGLRVLADVTALVADPARRAEHARWELLADCYMVDKPFAAMCVYDRRVVGDDGLIDIACVHPAARAPEHVVPFRVFGTADGVAVHGEVDIFSADAFRRSLHRVPSREGELVVDLSASNYLDHHAVAALVEWSHALAAREQRLVLRATTSGVRKVCHALELDTSAITFN